jgi:hypothetical protein
LIHRSAIALARGARAGVLTVRTPAAASAASNRTRAGLPDTRTVESRAPKVPDRLAPSQPDPELARPSSHTRDQVSGCDRVIGTHRRCGRTPKRRESAGTAWQEWNLAWCQPSGYPIDTHVDWEEWKDILSQAGIKDVRLHDARHTAGTLLGELHVDIHVIQRILGHAQGHFKMT